VLLIDPEADPGGVCLYRGCIPSKAYLHVARLIRETEEASAFGVVYGTPSLDFARMREWKDGVVAKLTGGLSALAKAKGVRSLQGRAVFRDSNSLEVDGSGADRVEVRFDHAVIATGSRPAVLENLMPDCGRVMNSTDALELGELPGSLLVVGAGYIGLELGSVYAALGSAVTVVEMMPRALAGVDADLARVLLRSLETRLHAIHLETRVDSVVEAQEGLSVRLVDAAGNAREQLYDRILVAVGRRPNSSGLGLSNTAVGVDAAGLIRVDGAQRTADGKIFAIGDVVAGPQLAHKATHQGLIAAEVIAGRDVTFAPAAIPAVVFTDPEVAWCGLTEEQARADGRTVKIARFPWQASGRAATLGRSDGLTKLLIDPESERVLGAGIVGVGAGELIAEAVLAIEMGAVAEDLAVAIHPHPTLSETLMEAAEVFYGRSVHLHRGR